MAGATVETSYDLDQIGADVTSPRRRVRVVQTSALHATAQDDIVPIRRTSHAAAALRRCVSDVDSFTTEIWGKHTHLHHDSELPAELISLTDVDNLLTSTSALRWDHIRLIRDGKVIPPPSYQRSIREIPHPAVGQAAESDRILAAVHRGIASPAEVISAVTAGATLILQALHWYHRPIMQFCRDLELLAGRKCQANFYLGPPSAQAFSLHEDAHDLFVVQILGEKHWHLDQTPWEKDHGLAKKYSEVVLRAGDILYVPKGTPHRVHTESEMSGHLSIGILPNTWRDLLLETTRALLEAHENRDWDDELPLDWTRDISQMMETAGKHIADFAGQLASLPPESALSSHFRRFLDQLPDRIPGGLETRLQTGEIDEDAVLARRRGVPCELFTQSAAQKLYAVLGSRTVCMPLEFLPAMKHILAVGTIRPSDLADVLCREDRLELCQELRNAHLLAPLASTREGLGKQPSAQ